MEKNLFNIRIKTKRDTESNWSTNNPVLLNGEIILVDCENGQIKLKIGDGIKNYNDLEFQNFNFLTDDIIGVQNGIVPLDSNIKIDSKFLPDNFLDMVTITSGAEINLQETIGEGPYTIEFTEEEEDSDFPATLVTYDNKNSNINANNVQEALDELKVSIEDISAKALYVTISLPKTGWSSLSQTATVNGILATEMTQMITVIPALTSQQEYYTAEVMVTAQAENSLTFTCAQTPASDLTVYVVVMGVTTA